MTREELVVLTSMQAKDEALWAPAVHIETAYVQNQLRLLTSAIEGDISFIDAARKIMDCQQ